VLRLRVYAHVWRTIIVALSLLGSACLSDAQLDEAAVERCGNLHSQSEMSDCAASEAHKVDNALNSTYQEVLRKLKSNKTATARMVAAEKLGLPFAMQNSRQIGLWRMERIPICCTGLSIRFVTTTHARH
jgi:uncharacterized protein YecT (DUF1311 family)